MALSPEQIARLRGDAGLSAVPPEVGNNSDDIIAQRKARLKISDAPEVETETTGSFYGGGKDSVGTKIIDSVSAGAFDIQKGMETGGLKGVPSVLKGMVKSGARVAGDVAGAVYRPVAEVAAPIVGAVDNFTGNRASEGIGGVVDSIADTVSDIPAVQEFAMKHPNAGEDVVRLLNLVMAKGETGKINPRTVLERTKGQVTTAIDTAKNIPSKVKSALPTNAGKTPNDLEVITDMISPKPTTKEAKLAMNQGRLYTKKGGFFEEGNTGKIAASEQQAKSARTIKELIPDAGTMDEPTLYKSIDNTTDEISIRLKPEMQKVKVNEQTVKQITDDWTQVKKIQKENPYTPSDIKLKKLQQDFETRLQKSKAGTIDDLWETRKSYDESVPEPVKKANDLSSDALQAQKDIWIQNRKVLSDAITNSENGLGEAARKPFADMRNLYEAKTGILSKAKADTATPSKFGEFMNTKKGKTLKQAAQIFGGGAVIGGGINALK